MPESGFWPALLLTAFAGLSTGAGSLIAFFSKQTNMRFLSWATGFSGGVMLYVSFVEILPKAVESIDAAHSLNGAEWMATASFFAGIALTFIIDQLIPHADNPHESRSEEELACVGDLCPIPAEDERPTAHLERTGIFTALAVGIHNFPEGMVTFLAALADPALGVSIALAVALHNIPEGISVSVPIYYATGNRRRALLWSLLSGLAEPVGALLGYVVLRRFITPALMGVLFGSVAGVMIYISLDELLPTSRTYGRGHDSLYGLMGGMAVMALSLLLF
ncbi:MAG: zinc transporter ZupT [Chloroflexi bacterium]|nr:zinc transporter ZupT [Chloroflexota bacterium]